jgi:hypothetical protein
LAGLPSRVCRIILDGLDVPRFEQASCADAADTLEIAIYFNWAKAAAYAVVYCALLAVVSDRWTLLVFALLLWIPAYMIVVGVLHQILKRTPGGEHRPVTSRPKVLFTLRWAPWIGAFLAAGLVLLIAR